MLRCSVSAECFPYFACRSAEEQFDQPAHAAIRAELVELFALESIAVHSSPLQDVASATLHSLRE